MIEACTRVCLTTIALVRAACVGAYLYLGLAWGSPGLFAPLLWNAAMIPLVVARHQPTIAFLSLVNGSIAALGVLAFMFGVSELWGARIVWLTLPATLEFAATLGALHGLRQRGKARVRRRWRRTPTRTYPRWTTTIRKLPQTSG